MLQHTTRSMGASDNPQADTVFKTHAVFCGRFSPFHLGHETVVRQMLDQYGEERSCIVIGSSNAPMSARDYFTADERQDFIRKVFPRLKTAFAPDYESDDQWLSELDMAMRTFNIDPKRAAYFAGSSQDVPFFFSAGRQVIIVNRYDGTTPVISATEVRQALVQGTPIDRLVNPLIAQDIRELFRARNLS